MTATSASRAALLAGLSVLAIYAAHVVSYIDYVNDDAYITFRYSRNLATGAGPYFNPGEPVEGYTSLLLMLAMALVFAAGGEAAVPVAAKTLGTLAAAATLFLSVAVARRLAPGAAMSDRESLAWGVVAAGLVAVSPGFVVNSVSGLETALLGACLIAAVWSDSGDRSAWRGTAAWLSLAVLTRPEGILVAGVYLAARLAVAVWTRRRSRGTGVRAVQDGSSGVAPADAVRAAAVVGAVYLARLVFRYVVYDGELLPNTYYAKAGGFWGTGAWEYIRAGALAPLLGAGGAFLGVLGWLAPGRPRQAVVPLAVTAVVGVCLPFAMGTDWMIGWRFTAPYLPLLTLTFVFGWVRLTGLGGRSRERLALALIVALPIAGLAQGEVRRDLRRYVAIKAGGYRNGHTALADWLRGGRAKPGDRIALMDIGIISYRCIEQRVLDITGLTDRVIARSPGEFLKKRYDPGYVLDQEPEFIVLAYVVGGDPRQPPPPNAPIHAWSPIEVRLSEQPAFQRWYRRARAGESPDSDWKRHFARRLGAERVFLHDDPEIHYLLAVYGRREAAASEPAT